MDFRIVCFGVGVLGRAFDGRSVGRVFIEETASGAFCVCKAVLARHCCWRRDIPLSVDVLFGM